MPMTVLLQLSERLHYQAVDAHEHDEMQIFVCSLSFLEGPRDVWFSQVLSLGVLVDSLAEKQPRHMPMRSFALAGSAISSR